MYTTREHLTCVGTLLLMAISAATAGQPQVASQPSSQAMFIPNAGQWSDESVRYGLKGQGMSLACRDSALSLFLRQAVSDGKADSAADALPQTEQSEVSVAFPGSNIVSPIGIDSLPTIVNYYVGGAGRDACSGLQAWAGVLYRNLYDGIDLAVTFSDAGSLKYEFRCEPGADYAQIRLAYDGIQDLCVTESGDVSIETSLGTLSDKAPIAWQDIEGARRPFSAHFEALDSHTYIVRLQDTPDLAYPLTIDPEVEWMTYLGGSDDEYAIDVTADSEGSAYVVGYTLSTDFEGHINDYSGGDLDAFVCKVNSSGLTEWATYLGSTGGERGRDVALSPDQSTLYVSGWTSSPDIPGRINEYHGGDWDACVFQVASTSGALGWMTYLGGSSDDRCEGIAVSDSGRIALTGYTTSFDFEGRINDYYDNKDAFICTLTPAGTVEWMTYLGGSSVDSGVGISLSHDSTLYVVGTTHSDDFEGRNNARHNSGFEDDGFLCRVDASGSLLWMTYLGGGGDDDGTDVGVDTDGSALVAGTTDSADFEARVNTLYGYDGVFVCKVTSNGNAAWMRYVGGTIGESGAGIALADDSSILISGRTNSDDFVGRQNEGHYLFLGLDAFICKMWPSGGIAWMLYLGGTDQDYGSPICVVPAGGALVSGYTESDDFEGRNNDFRGWRFDCFLVKVDLTGPTNPCLTVDGTCPGKITVSLCCSPPGDRLAIVYSLHAGSTEVLPYCPGLSVDLQEPKLAATGRADESGCLVVNGYVSDKACGRALIQGVNLTACTKSEVLSIK